MGDAVLRAAAQALAADLRPFDRAFRIGGEEFAVLLPRSDAAGARLAAERLRQAVAAQQIPVDGAVVVATVSVGVAVVAPGMAPAMLLAAADAALFRAKSAGRNQVVVSEE